VVWANLMAAARAWATDDTPEARAALSREAKAWAAVDAPRREASGERSPVSGDGWTFRFGKNKGKGPGEVDVRDLRWYERVFLEGLDDPAKQQYRESNQRSLDVVRAELRRRGEAGDW
jgi:hypothetical protein